MKIALAAIAAALTLLALPVGAGATCPPPCPPGTSSITCQR